MSGIFDNLPPPRILNCPKCEWQQYAFDHDIEATIRARVLAEVRKAVEEIVKGKAESGVRSNTGFQILALFDKGGPFAGEFGESVPE